MTYLYDHVEISILFFLSEWWFVRSPHFSTFQKHCEPKQVSGKNTVAIASWLYASGIPRLVCIGIIGQHRYHTIDQTIGTFLRLEHWFWLWFINKISSRSCRSNSLPRSLGLLHSRPRLAAIPLLRTLATDAKYHCNSSVQDTLVIRSLDQVKPCRGERPTRCETNLKYLVSCHHN